MFKLDMGPPDHHSLCFNQGRLRDGCAEQGLKGLPRLWLWFTVARSRLKMLHNL